jgi:hypothetical protein
MLACLTLSGPAYAGRPLITDDAATVGEHRLQLETWLHLERRSARQLVVLGFGPWETLELSLAGRHGLIWEDDRYAAAGPLIQAKWVLFPLAAPSRPGIALVAGTGSPFGMSALAAPDWEMFAYGAVTASPLAANRLVIHLNAGLFHSGQESLTSQRLTWGAAAQLRLLGELHAAAEVASGDPYAEVIGGIVHAGLRYFVSDNFQLDVTAGTGVWGEPAMPWWGTAGIRLASGRLW